MTHNNSQFAGCCGARIIYDVYEITAKELSQCNKNYNKELTLYAIVNPKRQATALKKFYKAGWKNLGRKWKAPSGNTLQTIVRYPIK